MDTPIGFLNLLKVGVKLVSHKFTLNRLTTDEEVQLTISNGRIKGNKRLTFYDEEPYYAFEGIPFARPPLGALRFRAPMPPEPWTGVRDCTKCQNRAMQKHSILLMTVGSEDCLYLNVYAKKLESDHPLPVMVWIYGGGFQIGEASTEVYAPDYFMKQDVILVEISYRLNVLGFLSLSDPDLGVPGNAGLKDQLMALRWVKDNIAQFNGDPNNITVFGESAGAASVHYLMLNEKAKGLFHKAIMQSGSAICDWATTTTRDMGYRLACKLGFTGTNNDKAVFQFLNKANVCKMVKACPTLLTKREKLEQMLLPFVPVEEPYASADSFITQPPIELLKTTWSNDIPLIIGTNSCEGWLGYPMAIANHYLVDELGDCAIALPDAVRLRHTAAELSEMGLKLRQTHFRDEIPSFSRTFDQYLDMYSYKHFVHDVHRTIMARIAYAPHTPTYRYRFAFDSEDFNIYRNLLTGFGRGKGASHADELSYLFFTALAWKLPKKSREYQTIERMINLWTTFATTGYTNCAAIRPAIWEPVNNAPSKCLNINDTVEFIDVPEARKIAAWDALYTRAPLY